MKELLVDLFEDYEAKFSKNAKNAINSAFGWAKIKGYDFVGTEHLLLGMTDTDCTAQKLLARYNITSQWVSVQISKFNPQQNSQDTAEVKPEDGALPDERQTVKEPQKKVTLSPTAKHVLQNAIKIAEGLDTPKTCTEHILFSIMQSPNSMVGEMYSVFMETAKKLYIDTGLAIGLSTRQLFGGFVDEILGNDIETEASETMKYSRDITELAAQGKLDVCVGRTGEIERLIQVLCRRTKNNPCLVGEPGVGKTAVLEGLAQWIVQGKVPDLMKNKKILSLDLSSMVAGTQYRGMFEERLTEVIREVMASGDIILFIDELHTMIGAGDSEGGMDAANILKPALSRGELQVIGSTTLEEYRKHIEKDAALERRFQPISIEEPTIDETVEILKGLRPVYEKHHGVKISDEAVIAAAKLSARYVNDRFLPDKAIDAMDEAASRLRIGDMKKEGSVSGSDPKRTLEQVQKELSNAIKKNDFEKAAILAAEEEQMIAASSKPVTVKTSSSKRPVLMQKHVEEVIAMWTKIPVEKVKQEESEKLLRMEEALGNRVKGQNVAVSAITKAIRRGRVGIKEPNRPVGSFLFLGPTGVGKTELSKALAEVMFGDENAMIRVDMSEYMEKHSVSKIIGSPPGYVGHEDGGQLSEQIRRKPYAVVLFDEVEKAHPDVLNILLQVLDDGRITDAQGRKVSFKNTIIIMTSNAGAQSIMSPKTLGFAPENNDNADYERMKGRVLDEIKTLFKPEFLNRIDETIVFRPLSKDVLKEIAGMQLDALCKRSLENIGVKIDYEESVKDFIFEKGYDPKFGARPIRRAVQTYVEDPVAEHVLRNPKARNLRVKVDGEGKDSKVVIE